MPTGTTNCCYNLRFSDGANWTKVQICGGLPLSDALFVRLHDAAGDGVFRARLDQPPALYGRTCRVVALLRYVSLTRAEAWCFLIDQRMCTSLRLACDQGGGAS